MGASYEKFDYSIRPNKRTQRKMIFDVLARYIGSLPRSKFTYVGFGSMWFTDFLYAHRRLGLRRLTSIERESGYARARFNRPFSCVRVESGDSSQVLPRLKWDDPSIVWLDYDYPPDAHALEDLRYLAATLKAKSVLLVTFDARPAKKVSDRLPALVRTFRDSVPSSVTSRVLREEAAYPACLVRCIWSFLRDELVRSGRTGGQGLSWRPLFSFAYKDGAPMVTVAGAILPRDLSDLLDKRKPFVDLDFVRGEQLFQIAIPPLTPKERAALDRQLPGRVTLPFDLDGDFLTSYRALYRYYPLLGEVEL